jgi:predicted nucleic acid-binding OB-fold protein
LTSIKQSELTQTRDAELTQAIEKIVRQRKYQGDRIVFRNSEEFVNAGMKILEKYNATDNERTWFLSLV